MILGLTTNCSSNLCLPGENYPSWLAYKGEGTSVLFQVPEDSNCCMKGIIVCVVYSSTSENMGAKCLTGVLIINYTKCTIKIYKQDTVMSFNDENWKGLTSNLETGDSVEIFVAFGRGLIVKPSFDMKLEPSQEDNLQSSPEANLQLSPNVKMEPSRKPNKDIFTRLAKRTRECLCLN
ncbi:hypothetical protein MTR_5g029940 [Medicago truncatula]|uniref:Uncharacterized protein n=1 Tax=Medicago truncatula TaxID=3880 RepID=G7KDQ9_MEDTR|nr:hypothetical protein MTR_5g029940 [Medicago truncatula]